MFVLATIKDTVKVQEYKENLSCVCCLHIHTVRFRVGPIFSLWATFSRGLGLGQLVLTQLVVRFLSIYVVNIAVVLGSTWCSHK